MKLKSIITFSILIVLSFSIVHEFVFVEFDEHHCSASEFVTEFDAPNDCDDICDIHYKYHHAVMFQILVFPIEKSLKLTKLEFQNETYKFATIFEIIKPPIS